MLATQALGMAVWRRNMLELGAHFRLRTMSCCTLCKTLLDHALCAL